VLIVVLLVGCAAPQIESGDFAPSADIERAIRSYYERHASEAGGRCFNPYIDGFTKLTVLEDTPDRLVVHARYFHRDRFREGGANEGGQACTGFAERTFALVRNPDGGLRGGPDDRRAGGVWAPLADQARPPRLTLTALANENGSIAGSVRLLQRQALEDGRRQAEATRDRRVIDGPGIEQDCGDRSLVEAHVGEQLGAADQTIAVRIVGGMEVFKADRIDQPQTERDARPLMFGEVCLAPDRPHLEIGTQGLELVERQALIGIGVGKAPRAIDALRGAPRLAHRMAFGDEPVEDNDRRLGSRRAGPAGCNQGKQAKRPAECGAPLHQCVRTS